MEKETFHAYSMYEVQRLCLYTQVFFLLMLPHPVHFLQKIFGRVNRMFYFNVPLYFDTFNPPVGASLMHTATQYTAQICYIYLIKFIKII